MFTEAVIGELEMLRIRADCVNMYIFKQTRKYTCPMFKLALAALSRASRWLFLLTTMRYASERNNVMLRRSAIIHTSRDISKQINGERD